jgi:MerR family transcriptional regulator, heat shock protein HspR
MSTDKTTSGVYLIGIVAELAGMHPQTLRLYERRGLIRPSRSAGHTRRYSDADLARLRRIQALSEAGLNIAGIERVLELERQLAEAGQALAALDQQLETQRTEHRAEMERARRSMRAEVVLVTRGETALVPLDRPPTRNRGR